MMHESKVGYILISPTLKSPTLISPTKQVFVHVTRVPLSIQTFDSVVKIHGMVLASSQGNVLGRLPCTV